MLTALALFIGVLAFWGFAGLRDSLTSSLSDKADKALQAKLRAYPEAGEMVALKGRVDVIEQLHAQMAQNLSPSPIAEAPEEVQTEETLRVRDYPPDVGS